MNPRLRLNKYKIICCNKITLITKIMEKKIYNTNDLKKLLNQVILKRMKK